jgi:hypothetical protein
MKGPPIRVSEAEQEDFVVTFNRRLRYATWGIVLTTIAVIVLVALLVPEIKSSAGTAAIWGGLVAILGPFMAIYYWAWNAPSRELQRRSPEGAALTKDEVRELTFSKVTYGHLVLAAVMGVAIPWRMSANFDIWNGLGMLWLVAGGSLITLSAVQTIRKWLHNKR